MAIHEHGNMKRNTYRPDETGKLKWRREQEGKSETTRLNHQKAERSETHGTRDAP